MNRICARWSRYRLIFKETAITSRDSLTYKDTYFVHVWSVDRPEVRGVGECALFRGLSADDFPEYEAELDRICRHIDTIDVSVIPYSSIKFGIETALLDLTNGGDRKIFDTQWSNGSDAITINGLVWMGDRDTMLSRLRSKIEDGYRCVKLKIGGINFEDEIGLLKFIREHYSKDQVTIRLDANGAFSPENASERLDRLARYDIHSIEQPIRQGQPDEMARLCKSSPIAIALDEELIGVSDQKRREEILDGIRPQYIILKPSLCGGIAATRDWIKEAEKREIGWWITSALESNVGLNAIAQLTSCFSTELPQGLGTGMLYVNNIESPLTLAGQQLKYDITKEWGQIP